jgi:hypothetical protein
MTDTATIPSPDHEALRVRVPSESGASAAGLAEQLDIPLLDDYLQTLLLPQVDSMLQYFPWKQQLPAALKLALLQLVTLWMSQGQTPATRALNLELVPSPSNSNSNSNSNASPRPSKRQPMGSWVNQHRLVVYSILSIGLPRLYQYAQEKWRQQQQQRQQHPGSIPEDDDETSIRRRARERRVQTVDTMFRVIDTAVPMMRLSLLLACWSWYSKSRTNTNTNTTLQALTPNLAMWLVGWQHQYQYQYQYQYQSTLTSANQNNNSNGGNGGGTSRQPLHVQHAHRRWLQEESMRLVPMVITPLWNTCQESRAYVQAWCRYVTLR